MSHCGCCCKSSAVSCDPQAESSEAPAAPAKDAWKTAGSIYEFEVNDIDGNLVKLEKYK